MSAVLPVAAAADTRNHAIRAVARLLLYLCDEPHTGVHELSRSLGISLGMVQRVTSTLVEAGLLVQDEETRKFSIGHAALRLGNAYLRGNTPVVQRCIAALKWLTDQTGETSSVHRIVGNQRVIVAQHESLQDLAWRSDISRPYPLHTGAASKALLAALTPLELGRLLPSLTFEHFQPSTPKSVSELSLQIGEARKEGVAISFSERVAGAGGVAATVFASGAEGPLAISVYGPEVRIRSSLKGIIRALRDTVRRVSVSDL